jgi:hypothetical protein
VCSPESPPIVGPAATQGRAAPAGDEPKPTTTPKLTRTPDAVIYRGHQIESITFGWCNEAEAFVSDLARLEKAEGILGRRYFGGRTLLFSEPAAFLRDLTTVMTDIIDLWREDLVGNPGPQRTRRKQKDGDPPEADGGRQPAPARLSAADLATYFADMARAQTTQALGDRVGAARYVKRYVRMATG